MQIEELQAKIYSNMSACHTKRANWHRTIETADKVRIPRRHHDCMLMWRITVSRLKALALDKENVKAKFRKAKAQGEIGYFEKAEVLMNELLAKNPPGVLTNFGLYRSPLTLLSEQMRPLSKPSSKVCVRRIMSGSENTTRNYAVGVPLVLPLSE